MGGRADLGFGAELEGFDPAEWTPARTPRKPEAPEERAASRQMAEATGFRSREPVGRGAGGPQAVPAATSAESPAQAAAETPAEAPAEIRSGATQTPVPTPGQISGQISGQPSAELPASPPRPAAKKAPAGKPAQPAPLQAAKPAAQQRRRRTGRNAQFNIKARPETIEAFCAVADAQGWGLGETLEHAVALLQKQHDP